MASGGMVIADTVRTNPVANLLAGNDDAFTAAIPLGFTVNFLGHSQSSIYVVNNGNIQFTNNMPGNFDPNGLTAVNGRQLLAPYMADVDTRTGNVVAYGTTTVDGRAAFIVDWPDVGYFDRKVDKLNNFQLVIIDRSDLGSGNFDIEFNYKNIQWQAESGSAVRAGFSDGTQTAGTVYLLPGSGVAGSFVDSNMSTGLVNSSNIGLPGRFLFLARNGAIVVLPIRLEAVGQTELQLGVARQMDKWQSLVGGNFGTATTQINSMADPSDQRNALERVGLGFLSSMTDTAAALVEGAMSNIAGHLNSDRMGRAPGATDVRLSRWPVSSAWDAAGESYSLAQMFGQVSRYLSDAGWGERRAALTDSVSVFSAAGKGQAAAQRTTNQIGYDRSVCNFTNGIDWRIMEHLTLGTAVDYGEARAEFGDARGDMDVKSSTSALFLSAGANAGAYIDAVAAFSRLGYGYSRAINAGALHTVAEGKAKAFQRVGRLAGGYDFKMPMFSVGPLFQVRYLESSVNDYVETGAGNLAAEVGEQRMRSIAGGWGGRIATWLETKRYKAWLYYKLLFNREFAGGDRTVVTGFSGVPGAYYDTPVEGVAKHSVWEELGLSAGMGDVASLNVSYGETLGNDKLSERRLMLAVSVSF
ncbi:MAG: autotransporter domain-containing protein [Candidatus Omnitrophica bacterium]|nr:autotransporter domain-containing protein [Candidatus Omnitrophota bacterium]